MKITEMSENDLAKDFAAAQRAVETAQAVQHAIDQERRRRASEIRRLQLAAELKRLEEGVQ